MKTLAIVLAFIAIGAHAADQPIGCLIEPDQSADIGAAVTGVIAHIPVERGDIVQAGQVLVSLRDTVERAQIGIARSRAQTEADIRAAQANRVLADERLKRARDLHQRQFISAQALDQAEAEHRVAVEKLAQARDFQQISQRELDLAQARLGERVLHSPFDGIVTDRYLSVGERVEDKPVLRIAKLHPLRVEIVLPNTLYGTIAPGMIADIQPDLPGLGVLNAQVTRVDKVMDAASNTFRARLTLPNADHAIPAGVRCTARFIDRHDTADAAIRPAGLAPARQTSPALRLDPTVPDFTRRAPAAPRQRM
ncbi:MAG: efflux RND transporter periplasmic adaptor subunit [Proteobacteria bacterium]|nr:MAG: efflux RND transporter periplasmic adaptor subunit [Pseudomonadota bacterium]